MNDKKLCTIITGASSGLGKFLSFELAKSDAKQHFLLIGRNQAKLNEVAQHVIASGNKIYILAIDLCLPEAINQILLLLEEYNLSVDTLYNNAGIGYHGSFVEMTKQQIEKIIMTNINALVFLTHAVLPQLLENRGKLVNIASVYAGAPVPKQVVYSATKAFLQTFSNSLASEYYRQGLSVSCVYPGSIATAFRTRIGIEEKNSRFTASAETVAKIIIDKVAKKKLIIIPVWYNRLFMGLNALLPMRCLTFVVPFLIYKLRKVQEMD